MELAFRSGGQCGINLARAHGARQRNVAGLSRRDLRSSDVPGRVERDEGRGLAQRDAQQPPAFGGPLPADGKCVRAGQAVEPQHDRASRAVHQPFGTAGEVARPGVAVDEPQSLNYLIATKPIGSTAKLTFLRDGRSQEATLKLEAAPGGANDTVTISGNTRFAGTTAATTRPADGPPRFIDRIPPKLRGAEVWAVQAEDHYLRLHTSRGQDLILMRLSDAVAELEGLDGAQVHRSWWVSRAAVRGVQRGDGRATLTLPDGHEVPVSRSHARRLRAAGWL